MSKDEKEMVKGILENIREVEKYLANFKKVN